MKRKKGEKVEFRIDSLVYGGKGIGEIDGWKVFMQGVAPGDLVRGRLIKIKGAYGEAQLEEVLENGPTRITPKCKHFGTCGGCKWQFLPYEEQIAIKERQVKDSIVRIGELNEKLVKPAIPCSEPWFYRNKMELSFGDGPGVGGQEDETMLGFYPPRYHYDVFNLDECFLMSDCMSEIVSKVRDFVNVHELKAYNKKTGDGLLRNLMIREGKNTDEIMVVLVTNTAPFDYSAEFKKLFEKDKRVTSLYWNSIHQVKGEKTWTEEKLLSGKETLTEKMRTENGIELTFEIRPQAFFQTNTKQAEVLYSKVIELAGLTGKENVFDLYCGTGTIGLFCAHKAGKVIGVELNESAVKNARDNAVKNGIDNASFYLGQVEKQLAAITDSPDVIIVDPLAVGLETKSLKKLPNLGQNELYMSHAIQQQWQEI